MTWHLSFTTSVSVMLSPSSKLVLLVKPSLLRRIGIIITENNLAETARNLGIRKSIRNMTEQEKIQLRYVTALQQTQNAQTDLARTMTQPENLLRIFNEQWQVLIRNLGSSFIPYASEGYASHHRYHQSTC